MNTNVLNASRDDRELRRLIDHSPLAAMCVRCALETEMTVDALWRAIAITLGAAHESTGVNVAPMFHAGRFSAT